jgi:hypothetical protein
LPFDLVPIVVVLITRRPFEVRPGFDLALTDVGAFLAAVFLAKDLDLTCFFAAIFFPALDGLDVALVASLLNGVFAAFFTAFLIRAFFATFLATFAIEILLCFDTEAVLEEAGFFFNSFFFFETVFEMVLFAATLFFVPPFWRLESVSLITISFY